MIESSRCLAARGPILGSRNKNRAYWFTTLAGGTLFTLSSIGQEIPSPSLQAILEQVEANREFYRSHIPDFFCSEHVRSQEDYGKHLERKQVSLIDSMFHLTRIDGSDQQQDLIESRSDMHIDGSASGKNELKGPVVLSNAFSRGLDTVSLSQKECYSYSVQEPSQAEGKGIERVEFKTRPNHTGSTTCVFDEQAEGSVTFDEHSHQVTEMQATIPRHLIARGYFGRWDLSVKYGPVSLGEHVYWVPLDIYSTLVPEDSDDAVWTFTAAYTNFHKYEVKSRVLP